MSADREALLEQISTMTTVERRVAERFADIVEPIQRRCLEAERLLAERDAELDELQAHLNSANDSLEGAVLHAVKFRAELTEARETAAEEVFARLYEHGGEPTEEARGYWRDGIFPDTRRDAYAIVDAVLRIAAEHQPRPYFCEECAFSSERPFARCSRPDCPFPTPAGEPTP